MLDTPKFLEFCVLVDLRIPQEIRTKVWLLSSTKLKTIVMSIHWSCMHPLKMLSWLHTFPTSFPKIRRSYPRIDGLCIPCFWTLVSMQQVSLCLKDSLQFFIWVGSFCTSFLVAWRTFSCRLTWEFSTSNFELPCSQFPGAWPILFLSSSFTGLTQSPKSTLAVAVGEPSFEVVSCPLFDMAPITMRSLTLERKFLKRSRRIHWETHYIEQTQEVIPFIFRETSIGWNVSELVFGVSKIDLDFGFQIDSVK